jgi:hypothetical protein
MKSIWLNRIPAIILAISFVLLASMAAEDPVGPLTDVERLELEGPVRSLLETRRNAVASAGNAANGEVTYKKLTSFNTDGFATECVIYNNNGRSSRMEYVFDTAVYPVGLKEYTEDGTLWLTLTYKLDDKGNKLEAEFDWLNKAAYDEIREKSEQLYELLDRNPWDRIIYENDYRGFPREERYLKNDGRLLFKFTYKYDVRGNKTEMIYFNSKGRTSWETKYKHDRQDRMKESTIYKSNRVAAKSKYTYTYDEYGNWVSRLEERNVTYNILTANLEEGYFLTERKIEYY